MAWPASWAGTIVLYVDAHWIKKFLIVPAAHKIQVLNGS